MRIWAKLWLDNHMIKDTVIENYEDDTRTHKVFNAIDEICRLWDLSKPIWLDININDFKKHSRTKFTKDCFIEEVEFDSMEIMVIDED